MMKDERGFTLVELLITVAITGLIVSFLGTAIYQIITVTEYGNDKMVAMHELQNAVHWVSLDGHNATTASGGSELILTLHGDSSVTYAVVGTELHRTASGSQMTLARNISAAEFLVEERQETITVNSFFEERTQRVITMTVTSSPEGRPNISEQRTYKLCLRPTEPSEGQWRVE